MGFKHWKTRVCIFLLTCLAMATVVTHGLVAGARSEFAQQGSSATEFISADELKAKLTKKEPVTIVDVRSANSLLDSGDKIKGAVYVKLRRLRYRLAFPPLKDIPRDQEVVTYCACPNDEASVKAAQMLQESGFKRVRVLKGGWVNWKRANGPVEPMARGM
jgi:rhodanese-related sulfurtransferase